MSQNSVAEQLLPAYAGLHAHKQHSEWLWQPGLDVGYPLPTVASEASGMSMHAQGAFTPTQHFHAKGWHEA
jgi:hypothetical protein